jgi:hypothetical protein
MIGTGLAILGAGALGAGASIWGANEAADTQADAAREAAALQAKGQADALAFQKDVFGNQLQNFADAKTNFEGTKGNLQPFVNTGIGANNLLASAYGLNGTDPALGKNALDAFRLSPDYQFALKGGTEALDNSAASKGGLINGNQIRAQTEYGQGLATQNLQGYFARLAGMSTQGQNAAGTLGTLGNQLGSMGTTIGNGVVGPNASTNIVGANNVAQSTMGAGTADASGTLGTVKGIQSGANALALYNQMGRSSYGTPGGFGSLGGSYNPNQIGGLY